MFVCVEERRENVRLCLDFRQLNQITECQVFLMQNVDEMLGTLYGSEYFSSIDLRNAYYQVELDREKMDSQEKLHFL